MFCLNCICLLILLSRYIGQDFTLGALKAHRYIGDIVISRIVVSGFQCIHIYIYIDKLGRSLEPTAHLSPQRGSLMDSQSKPRRNVMNYREFRGDQGRTTL